MTSPTRTTAHGAAALELTTRLLHRVRLADPHVGSWEAADPQWWSRRPRPSDDVDRPFWSDDEGPVAGLVLTAFRETTWQLDVVVAPVPTAPAVAEVWAAAQALGAGLAAYGVERVDVPVYEDATELRALVEEVGWTPADPSWDSWLDTGTWPGPPRTLAQGYRIADRAQRADVPHPMSERNGPDVGARLDACSLYDRSLDLRVETSDGQVAGYALCWADPVTRVGLVEPVRVEEAHQRRGLASTVVAEGVARLGAAGMDRVKIGFESTAARAVYEGVGFVPGKVLPNYVGAPADLA